MSQVVVMGICGCGKSSVAHLLASRLGGVFLDADDFHPPENRAKMSAGISLTDDDRWPWLDALNHGLRAHAESKHPVFLACSALRQVYRDRLCAGLPSLRFIYLKGPREVILRRMQSRKDHFMPAALLDSQFAILEEPKDAIIVSVENPLPMIVEHILTKLLRLEYVTILPTSDTRRL